MDQEFGSKLLSAPLSIQVAIGAGYLGYLAAYSGLRAHHKQVDTAFLTLAFGLFASLFFTLTVAKIGTLGGVAGSVALSVLLGFLWRGAGSALLQSGMRWSNLAFTDDDPTALATVYADTKHNVTQVLVTLEDGRELLCQDTGRFRDAAIRPLVLGGDGSVAMYVTHTYRRGTDGKQVEREESDVRDPIWGDNLTIIPASRIQQIDLRFQKKLSPPS